MFVPKVKKNVLASTANSQVFHRRIYSEVFLKVVFDRLKIFVNDFRIICTLIYPGARIIDRVFFYN